MLDGQPCDEPLVPGHPYCSAQAPLFWEGYVDIPKGLVVVQDGGDDGCDRKAKPRGQTSCSSAETGLDRHG